MKLMVVNSMDFGGLEKQVYDLITNYPEKIYLVCLNKIGHFGNKLIKKGHKVILLKGDKTTKIKKLRKIIKKLEIKTIISENTAPMQYSILASLFLKIRRVHVDHNSFAEKESLRIRIENKFFSRFINQFIAVSPFVKKNIIRKWHVNPKKIKIITNGVDIIKPNNNKKELKKTLGLKNEKIVSIIGGLRPVKDHITILKAFEKIKDINTKLLIIGDGPLRKKLEKYSNNTLFLGWRADVLDLINISDVVVCSSLNEGISITLLEAMSLGKPIIATNVGGNKILVQENGFLFKKRDSEILKILIKKLLSNKKLAKEMGKISLNIVKKDYTIKKMIENYKKTF